MMIFSWEKRKLQELLSQMTKGISLFPTPGTYDASRGSTVKDEEKPDRHLDLTSFKSLKWRFSLVNVLIYEDFSHMNDSYLDIFYRNYFVPKHQLNHVWKKLLVNGINVKSQHIQIM